MNQGTILRIDTCPPHKEGRGKYCGSCIPEHARGISRCKYLFLIAVLSIIICQNVFADRISVSEFTITITKVEVSYDSGSTYTTIYESSTGTTIDLGATTQNTRASLFPLAAGFPEGTINKVQITIATTLSFTGYYYYTIEDAYYAHTALTIDYSELLNTACGGSSGEPTPEKVTVTNLPDSIRIFSFDTSISVTVDETKTIKLNMDLSSSLIFEPGGFAGIDKLYTAPFTTIGSIGT